ncbi:cutinase [Rhizoctonia solani AG-3 Rhs1AP]|uniref:Cutinase n=2 Tax=Rhizoctonia solani AG-3 TaxID=1086053 RepID=A0A074S1E0_9AGAM|nr:cutinase [Rhizoctonia solani AG-3 Rhs1AP]KEP50703.1 cutinase [Rhizoctonia solani 123E]
MLLIKALFSLLFFAISSRAAPIDGRQTSCSALQLIFLAGTNEDHGLGSVGGPLSAALTSAVSGTTTYSVPYDTSVEYGPTITAGARMTVEYITAQAARCPSQRFALGGYSKGAMVLHSMSLSSALKAKVTAIVVFGDPYRGINNNWPISSPVVNSKPRSGFTNSQNVASFCNDGDIICRGGLSVPAHLTYGEDGSTGIAAAFIQNHL